MLNFVASIMLVSTLHVSDCKKTFTRPMITRAINATYYGTKTVRPIEKRRLRRYIHCARPKVGKSRMRQYWKQAEAAWWNRLHPPMVTQLASWYYDGGNTACGFHASLGVANKILPCGTRVLFSYHGRSAYGIVQDRGPYVGGRVWDLNQGLAGALGFSGVDYVQASIGG